MLPPTKSILLMIFAYLAGSIPFGFLIAMFYSGIDIRDYGSKNIGMTNVFRTLGPVPGIATLFLDALKGYIIVIISLHWIPLKDFGYNYIMWSMIICIIAFLAIIGHSYPVWLGFKGGKSVAVSFGVLAAIMSWWVLVPVAVFLFATAASRYVSVGSLLSAISVPVLFAVFKTYPQPENPSDIVFIVFSCILALLVIIRHTSNIKRLLSGTENRIGKSRKPVESPETPEMASEVEDRSE